MCLSILNPFPLHPKVGPKPWQTLNYELYFSKLYSDFIFSHVSEPQQSHQIVLDLLHIKV